MFGKGSHDDNEFVTAEVSTSPLRWSEVGERVGEAVKSKGQEKATVEEEMSVTNAQAGNTKDQVKLKRMRAGFTFQLTLNSRGTEGTAGRGQ